MKWSYVMMILNKQRPPIDMWHYIVGHYRYYFFYGGKWSKKFGLIAWLRKKVLRKHIKEQIGFRFVVMDKVCYDQGSCKICGCETTMLQMASKSCDKPCYPPMLSKSRWKRFMTSGVLKQGKNIWIYNEIKRHLTLVHETLHSYVQVNKD